MSRAISSTLLASILSPSPTVTTTATSSYSTISASPSCVTVTPGKYGYVPSSACNAQWNYSPSFAAAVLFSCLFGLVTVTHIFLAAKQKKVSTSTSPSISEDIPGLYKALDGSFNFLPKVYHKFVAHVDASVIGTSSTVYIARCLRVR